MRKILYSKRERDARCRDPTEEQEQLQSQEENMGDTEKLANCSVHESGRKGCRNMTQRESLVAWGKRLAG